VAHRERPGLRSAAAATRKGVVDAPPGEPGRAERRRGQGALSPRLEDAGDRAKLVLATAGGAVGRFAEAVLFVAALELLPAVPSHRFRLGVLGALVTLGAALLLFELTAAGTAQALGRRREVGLRLRLGVLEKLWTVPLRLGKWASGQIHTSWYAGGIANASMRAISLASSMRLPLTSK